MRRTLFLPSAFALLTAGVLPAQDTQYYRPSAGEAPRVRVQIDGQRSLSMGSPVRIRFEVDDNAFVTVVRVDGNGRMQILFPHSRNQRAAVRGGQVNYVRNPRLGGEIAFIANDRMGGYVFALASYAPLDFSSFENRDYDRIGAHSAFTVANRSIARQPDVFIDRFAARVLWDVNTPYDYDVDYYFQTDYPGTRNAYALCASLFRYGVMPYYSGMMFDWDSWGYGNYPSRSMCRDYYNGLYCYSPFSYVYYGYGCSIGAVIATGPTVPGGGQPTDTATFVPNEGVVKGGMLPPTPVPVPVGGPEALPQDRPFGRFDRPLGAATDLDDIKSIPTRAKQKLKDEEARREGGTNGGSASASFDRAVGGTDKDKTRTADASTRAEPPSREPTKAKAEGEPRRDTRSKGGYGTTSRPADIRSKPQPVSRPDTRTTTGSSTGSSSNPQTMSGAGEKKKPPQD